MTDIKRIIAMLENCGKKYEIENYGEYHRITTGYTLFEFEHGVLMDIQTDVDDVIKDYTY